MWHKKVLTDTGATNLRYGLACSPIVWGKSVVVLGGDGTKEQMVVAYDYLNGRRAWAALSDTGAYTSPLQAELAGQRQLILVAASRALGFDPDSRTVLWEFPWKVQYDNAICVPVVVDANRFMLSAGYGVGAVMIEIRRDAGHFQALPLWRNRSMKNKFNASVFWQGHFYGLDEGVLACVNAQTGERIWRDGRYGYGQVLLASGHLIVLGGDGELALVKASPEGFRPKRVFPALEGKTWNEPALAHGRLLVRNAAAMACFDLRPTASPPRATR
jgi:outer membrane protein assembly factor BamB